MNTKNFYHVSTHAHAGDIYSRETKNNFNECKYVSSHVPSSYEEACQLLDYMRENSFGAKTGKSPEKWLCEAIFENVRKNCFSNLPSRIWGVFLCDSLEMATSFKEKERKPETKIFGVCISEDAVQRFNMNLFTVACDSLVRSFSSESYQRAVCFAQKYWANEDSNNYSPEFLTEMVLTIGKEV